MPCNIPVYLLCFLFCSGKNRGSRTDLLWYWWFEVSCCTLVTAPSL